MQKIIYCFWTGNNQMSIQRKNCFDTMNKSGCKIILITPENLQEYIIPNYPLHPAYNYLSLTHKSDYLRCYFMHHYGGGYSDIKVIKDSWDSAFDDMKDSKIYINGYQEIGPEGVAIIKGEQYKTLKLNYRHLIGLGSFICKPKTPFTEDWINELHKKLDEVYDELKLNPSTHPQEFFGMLLNKRQNIYNMLLYGILEKVFHYKNKRSNYPLEWSQILGQIFHPLCLKYKDNIKQTVPKPTFKNYR